MDDRYEIRGKIGQGGIGAVYAGYDKNLHREVAIKRIVAERTADLEVEASRQMAKEASALSKLQHPNIVTVYDVGVDNDGPFVVMELLHGKTIDEVVATAPLTWQDFREFALQTNEALIAAQDMDLLHRDLKPTNVMLNWLPSGKFQVKIVDFGLAKFSSKPSLQTIDQKDSIFGSIYFMAPEQFERVELDPRTDMYSIGCVYYYALTGTHPFNGDTGPQVMLSHLDHRVFPLHELRPDIPRWVADWVMWHINRLTEHRPANARAALVLFLQSEKAYPSAHTDQVYLNTQEIVNPLSQQPIPQARHLSSSLKITAPQPIRPPEQFGKPSLHTDAQPIPQTGEIATAATASPSTPASSNPVSLAPVVPTAVVEQLVAVVPPPVAVAPPPVAVAPPPVAVAPPPVAVAPPPVAVAPPPVAVAPTPTKTVPLQAANPLVIKRPTSALATGKITSPTSPLVRANVSPAPATAHPLAQQPTNSANHTPSPDPALQQAIRAKKASLDPAKLTMIAIVLGIVVIIASIALYSRISGNKEDKRYNELMQLAKDSSILEVNKNDLKILLENAVSLSDVKGRETIYKALFISRSTDGTNIDLVLTEFTTSTSMNEDIRKNLLRRVIGGRKSPASIPILINYVKNNISSDSAAAAIESIKGIVTGDHFDALIEILQFTTNSNVRKGCEESINKIFSDSMDKNALAQNTADAYNSSTSDDTKQILLRILGNTGSAKAKEIISAQFSGNNKIMQVAAADACRNWPNDQMFMELIANLDRDLDPNVRSRVFQSSIDFLTKTTVPLDDATKEKFWNALAKKATAPESQLLLIRSLVKILTPWSVAIVKSYADTGEEDDVIDLASKALRSMESKMKPE